MCYLHVDKVIKTILLVPDNRREWRQNVTPRLSEKSLRKRFATDSIFSKRIFGQDKLKLTFEFSIRKKTIYFNQSINQRFKQTPSNLILTRVIFLVKIFSQHSKITSSTKGVNNYWTVLLQWFDLRPRGAIRHALSVF